MLDYLNNLSSLILGFHPINSDLEILSEKEWKNFSLEHNLPEEVCGEYIPYEKTAYIMDAKKDELLRRASHEYIGHANFCEHSQIGKKITELNDSIFSLEKELLGSKFPKNKKITLAVGKEKRIIENEGLLIILPEIEERKITDYSIIRRFSEQFFQQNYELYEGFALWIESRIGVEIHPKRAGYIGFLKIKETESQDNFLAELGFFQAKKEVRAG